MNKYISVLIIGIVLLFSCKNEEKVIPAPVIYLQMPEGGFAFDTDSVEIIEPKITYDIKSVYAWYEGDVEINDGKKDLVFKDRPLGTYEFEFTVLTEYGDDTMSITAHSLDINTFEEFDNFNDNGYFNAPDDGFHQFKYVKYSCYNTTENWDGFAISKNASKSDSNTKGEFSVYGTSAADESDNFTIYKQSESRSNNISFDDGKAHVVKNIAVNNCTRSYLYMVNGFNKKEGKDFFLLSITGLNQEGTTIAGPIDFLLADYRPEETGNKYILSDWYNIDLTSLGAVNQLSFKLTSSRDDDEEFELPMYFCLDNLQIIE